MTTPSILPLLAEIPTLGGYFDPIKVGVFALLALCWAATCAWADKDTVKAKTPKLPWNAALFGAGGLGVALWIMLPNWLVGLIVFLVLYGGSALGYVFYRNSRVAPGLRVLTADHLRRLSSKKPAEEVVEAGDRVRIKGADGKTPKWPTDPEQREGYKTLQNFLFDTIWRRATQVDIHVAQQAARIIYRVDGVNREREPIERPLADNAFTHLKRIAGMDPAETRKPQSGKMTCYVGPGGKQDKVVDLQIKASGSTTGQRISLVLHTEESKFRVTDIGLNKGQLALVQPAVEKARGVVLVAGPKESGVTSTLYAMIRGHDAFLRNIHTLESSKQMDIENVTQHIYDSKGGEVSYSRQLQSVLRMDPDIVLVSDCVDRESAELIASGGRANRKIYVGINAGDTLGALRRYLQLVGDNELAAAGIECVIAQRLVRSLCPTCRRAYKPDPMLLKKANLPTGDNRPFYRPPNPNELETDKQGNPIICQVCQGSGYLGRTGIFEVLVLDDDIRQMLAQGAPLQNVKAHARKNKMQYLQEAGLLKVYEGITSINEVLRVTREEDAAKRATASPT